VGDEGQCGVIGGQPEELAAASRSDELATGQQVAELGCATGLSPHSPGVQDADVTDPTVEDVLGEPPTDGLHLRQLWHGVPQTTASG
jgi:hypothetical protein